MKPNQWEKPGKYLNQTSSSYIMTPCGTSRSWPDAPDGSSSKSVFSNEEELDSNVNR